MTRPADIHIPAPSGWPPRRAHIDTDLLLASGAVEGPYRRPHPITVTWRMRVSRALRSIFINRRSPL